MCCSENIYTPGILAYEYYQGVTVFVITSYLICNCVIIIELHVIFLFLFGTTQLSTTPMMFSFPFFHPPTLFSVIILNLDDKLVRISMKMSRHVKRLSFKRKSFEIHLGCFYQNANRCISSLIADNFSSRCWTC